jgi:hypothetical protein
MNRKRVTPLMRSGKSTIVQEETPTERAPWGRLLPLARGLDQFRLEWKEPGRRK